MNVYLQKLAEAYPHDDILPVLDNAGWHHSFRLVILSNITLFPLLPYTPELDPIEMIWDWIREKGFHNEVFASLALVHERLCQTVLALETIPCVLPRLLVVNRLMKH